MALFQNKNFLSSNKATIMCGQSDKNVQLPVRPRGLIDVRRKFNLLLCPIVICRLTTLHLQFDGYSSFLSDTFLNLMQNKVMSAPKTKAITAVKI